MRIRLYRDGRKWEEIEIEEREAATIQSMATLMRDILIEDVRRNDGGIIEEIRYNEKDSTQGYYINA